MGWRVEKSIGRQDAITTRPTQPIILSVGSVRQANELGTPVRSNQKPFGRLRLVAAQVMARRKHV